MQLGILAAQRFELSTRGVDGLLRCGNAGVSLGLYLVADALGILETSYEAVTGLARAGFARFDGIECGFETPLGGVVLFFYLFELRFELCCLGGMGIAADFCRRGGLLCRVDSVALLGDNLVVAACDILTRLELLALIGDALLKFGQVGTSVRERLLCGVHLAHGRGALGDKSAYGVCCI